MLKIAREPTFWAPVAVQVPQDGGGFKAHHCRWQFVVLPVDRATDLIMNGTRLDPGDEGSRLVTGTAALLLEATRAWDGVVGEDETPLDCTRSIVAAVVALPFVANAAYAAYVKGASGGQAKN